MTTENSTPPLANRSSEEKVYGEIITMLRHYDTLCFLTLQFYIAFLSTGLVLFSNGKLAHGSAIGTVIAVSVIFFLIAARLRQNHHQFAEVGKALESRLVAEELRPIRNVQAGLGSQPWSPATIRIPISILYYGVYLVGLAGGLALVLLN